MQNLTQKINNWSKGELDDENELFNYLYPKLKSIAKNQLIKSQNSELNATLVINETFLKLKQSNKIQVNDRLHFFAMAAKFIRRIIVDDFRQKKAEKRGGTLLHVTMREIDVKPINAEITNWLLIHQLLTELAKVDQQSCEIIELRFFAGLNINEIAELTNTSPSTVSRHWRFAKTWLLNKLEQ